MLRLCGYSLVFLASEALLLAAAATVPVATTSTTTTTPGKGCRFIPGDKGWPAEADWAQLNRTVGGRLIATVPRAHVCHGKDFDESACSALRAPQDFEGSPPPYVTRLGVEMTQWDNSTNFLFVPAEMQNSYFQNQSCDPFTPKSKPCELGNMAEYSIRIANAKDVSSALDFAHRKRIRLTIRNTGHDYLGRSSGKGSLSLWTQGLKSRQIIQKYRSPAYTGPAVKLGAGVTAGEALEFVSKSGFRVVTGECGTVGIVGGYSQGGGHGPLNGAYGLGSDNVLEWELVTGKGDLIVASPQKNKDIYWALSGGGGGTYGVVLGATIRIHRDGPVVNPQLGIAVADKNNDTFWDAVTTVFATMPELLEGNNNSAQFTTWNDNIGVLFTFPDQTRQTAEDTLAPLRKGLDKVGIPYVLNYAEHETYTDFYNSLYGPLPFGTQPPTTLLNSRIVPKRVVEKPSSLKRLIAAIRLTTEQGDFKVDCSAADVSQGQEVAENAVQPAWRDSILGCNILAFWNFTAPLSDNYAVKSRMVDIYAPAWDAATPGSGVYNNELDPAYKGDFKKALWGNNYSRLRSIKDKNDPHHLFYGYWAVGSDEYKIDGKGRLCDA